MNPLAAAHYARENRRSALLNAARIAGILIALTILSLLFSMPVNT